MNNPFDYIPDAECAEAFRVLSLRMEALKRSEVPADRAFCRELEDGKMLGVLVAVDREGARHSLFAFSGQLGCGGFFREGFVGPVFDYLQPDGYFKQREREISSLNGEIARFEAGPLSQAKSDYESAKARLEAMVADYREKCRLSKLARDRRREQGELKEGELAEMIRQSQFEKAELHRLKKRVKADLEPLAAALSEAEASLAAMKERRRADSEALQQWLFDNFKLLNARGESRSLSDIFAETALKIPPSGAGECCAPKLLQEVYRRGWQPLAMAEYWYGRPKGGEVRVAGRYYPACRGKCRPVLGWMLQGLEIEPPLDEDVDARGVFTPEIVYENEWFCVVDKPSGMLSVPGKGSARSLQHWLEEVYGTERQVKVAHRLDRDTSGLIVATFGEQPFKTMQMLFATRRVKKRYVAILEGDYKSRGLADRGEISLPLSPDWLDRPRQRVDLENGKEAVTDYEFQDREDGCSRVWFYPQTGRTHQLRVHAASSMGLGMPIAGDPLYGRQEGGGVWKGEKSGIGAKGGERADRRLCLHAQKLEFTFPIDGRHYCFESPVPF